MIYVHEWQNPFHAGSKRTVMMHATAGMTLRDTLPVDFEGHQPTCLHNGIPRTDLSRRVFESDHVDWIMRPGPQAIPFVIKLVVVALVSAATQLIIRSIAPRPKDPIRRGTSEESPTYGFAGIDNVRTEGQPLQVVYGEILMGGTIVNEFVRVVEGEVATADYYALIAFGEGPVYSIGGITSDTSASSPQTTQNGGIPTNSILVEGNDITNYTGVEIHVRLGSLEQGVVPGFEKSRTLTSVDVTLGQEDGNPNTDVFNISGSADTDTDTIPDYADEDQNADAWTNYGASYSLTDDADSATVTIDFPGGLYTINDQGNVVDARFTMAIRYIELDSGGLPIVSGGDNGDGYVYLVPRPAIVRRLQSAFAVEYAVPFYDPQSWTTGTPGGNAAFDGVDGYATIQTSQTLPGTYTGNVPRFTIEGWARLPASPGNAQMELTLFEWTDASSNGFAIVAFRRQTFGGQWRTFVRPVVDDGGLLGETFVGYDPTSGVGFPNTSGQVPHEQYFHWCVVYQRSGLPGTTGGFGGTRRWQIYINGQNVFNGSTNYGGTITVEGHSSDLYIGSPNASTGVNLTTGGTAPAATGSPIWRVDEVRWWNRAFTASDVQGSYQLGAGTFGTDTTDLNAGWHFDDASDVGTSPVQHATTDYSGNGNDLLGWPGNTSAFFNETNAATPAPVFAQPVGELKRGRYKVECLRVNQKSTSSRVQDEAVWQYITPEIDEAFSYPGRPLLGIKVRASDQLNTSRPLIQALLRGRLVPIWDGLNVFAPTLNLAYSNNPAWLALDLLTNKKFGLGDIYPVDKVDLPSLLAVATECDRFVYDGRGKMAGGANTAVTAGDPPAGTWIDLQYYVPAAANDDRGRLQVRFHNNTSVVSDTQWPTHWRVGRYVAFENMPDPQSDSGVNMDLNLDATGAFEIQELTYDSSAGGYVANLYWDRNETTPWTGASGGTSFITASSTQADATGLNTFLAERRFEFNGVFDTFDSVWDQLIELLRIARTMPVREGDRLRFRIERERPVVGLLTQGSVLREGGKSTFKYEYADGSDRANAYSVDFLDRDLNYVRSNEPVLHPDIDDASLPETIVEEPIFMLGVTSRGAAVRHARYLLELNKRLFVRGSFKTSPEAIAWEPGDRIMIAHDLVPWGQSGRFAAVTDQDTVTPRREVVITSGTWLMSCLNPNTQVLETVRIASGAGTYNSSTPINLDNGGFSFLPVEGAQFNVYAQGTEFSGIVTQWKVNSDLSVEVEWVNYDATTYGVDLTLTDEEFPLVTGGDGPPYDRPPTAHTFPRGAGDLQAQQVENADGETWVGLTWHHPMETLALVHGTRIFQRIGGTVGSEWEQVGAVRGAQQRALIRLPSYPPGTTVELSVVPVTEGGTAQPAELGAVARLDLVDFGGAPEAPSSFVARLNGDNVVYAWSAAHRRVEAVYEARVGGWVLGQPLFVSADRAEQTDPLTTWIEAGSDAAGNSTPTLYLRAKGPKGRYSQQAATLSFNPTPDETEVYDPPNSDTYPDQAWHDFGDGWVYDSSPPGSNATLTDVARQSDGTLSFSGSALTGSYQTPNWTMEGYERGERFYISAFVEGVQQHPLTLEEEQAYDSPGGERWTYEGPLYESTEDDYGNCTLQIMISILGATSAKGGGTWSDFERYKPGVYWGVAFRFRVDLTRPATTYDVILSRFQTRCRRIPKQRHEYSPLERYVQRRVSR